MQNGRLGHLHTETTPNVVGNKALNYLAEVEGFPRGETRLVGRPENMGRYGVLEGAIPKIVRQRRASSTDIVFIKGDSPNRTCYDHWGATYFVKIVLSIRYICQILCEHLGSILKLLALQIRTPGANDSWVVLRSRTSEGNQHFLRHLLPPPPTS